MKNPNSYAYRTTTALHYDYHDVDEDEDNYFQDNDDDVQNGNFDNSNRYPKKRKLESFVSNYEFVPRSDAWSEDESFMLLEVWGERYTDLGRRSLRGEDWVDVTEKVGEMSGRERTEAECRSQLDVMKNKYKKEMGKVESGGASKWVFFKKMDALLNLRTRGYGGLGCGLDSGECVFMNPRVYLDRSNVVDEMRDSPGQSDEDNEDDDDGGDENEDLSGDDVVDGESARLLAESIQKFGKMNEKIEESKRRQMLELETMRQDFQRELESQKKQIVELAQAEIAKMQVADDDDVVDGESARLLADSIQKFGKINEKIEESKRRQMLELETMRQDFQRELESQKKQIVEQAQAEIARMQVADDDEEDEEKTDRRILEIDSGNFSSII